MYPSEVYRSHLTPFRFLQRSAAVFREKTAVVYGDKSLTYPQLAERVYRLSTALRRAGIDRGDRVAVLLPNIPQMLEAHFGVPLSGGVLVAINTRLSADEILYILNHSGAKALIADTELASLVASIREHCESLRIVVNVDDGSGEAYLDGEEYEAFLESGSPSEPDWPIDDEEDVISINYTSGTTGRPKGVMYTHRGAYLNALGEIIETKMTSDSVYLWTLPMFHCNGWCYPWAVVAIGGTQVCLRKFDAGQGLESRAHAGRDPLLRRADGADRVR